MAERPDVVHVLAQPNWPVHMSGHKSRYMLAPLLAFEDGKLLLSLDPSRLGAHPEMRSSRSRHPQQVPELTALQLEALSVVSDYAEKNRVQIDTGRGDLVFINNWAVLHSRSAYEDTDISATRRHLLRLWLRNSELGWKIPESMRGPWEAAFGYTDEGYESGDYRQIVAQFKYDVVPRQSYKPVRYTTGSAAFAISDSEGESDDAVE
ncbi:hypothetical protein SEPCBS119000_000209 [Sporothrix epigloea]|uniref:TauD/TfdA-like domain-containing protein n=1 Tax=Sporothrix epigloea TaxID=1892477 RepID=A0ABP0D4T1_9PEZI